MSVQAMTRVMESSQTTGMTRLVLLVIANHETEDRGAFPAVHTIASEANCSDRAVQDAIGRARSMGEIEVSYRQGPNGTNVYRTLCGLRGAAPLPVADIPISAGVQNLRGADTRRESAPNRNELRGSGSVVDSTVLDLALDPKAAFAASQTVSTSVDTNPNQPTHDQLDLARKLGDTWNQDLSPAAVVKLNQAHGRSNVESAMRSLRGFPPEESVRKLYAYVGQIAADMEAGVA